MVIFSIFMKKENAFFEVFLNAIQPEQRIAQIEFALTAVFKPDIKGIFKNAKYMCFPTILLFCKIQLISLKYVT